MRVSGTNEKVDPKNEPIPVYADNDGNKRKHRWRFYPMC